MNKLSGIFFLIIFLSGCKSETQPTEELSFISFINTVSGVVNAPSIFVDTVFQFRIPYRGSYRNLQIAPGVHVLSIKDSSRVKTFINLPPQEFQSNISSTIVIYDTLHPVDSTVRAIRLSDDLTLAPNGFVKVRFIHAAPRTSPVDVTFLRTNVAPFDSVTFSSQRYLGDVGNVEMLSAFNSIPIGNYTLKIKSGGTQDTILNTLRLSVPNLAGSASITGITTFYLTGGVRGEPLQVGLFRHYP